jgi:bifunctional non-homologous end joining protein LigD
LIFSKFPVALKEYNKKRVFRQTPEPTGGKSSGKALHFVVQKHDATRLHYDFRLEMKGVLKSWAIPRGPSLNPEDRRLAMMVEDHPYDYKDFEGIIPQGNYGAGTVIVWDRGTYETLEPMPSIKETEKSLLAQLKAGSLKFRLFGKKLKGEFALIHIKNNDKGDNAWLLIKHRDEFADTSDITKKVKSVISGKTIGQVEKNQKAKQWVSLKKAAGTSASKK